MAVRKTTWLRLVLLVVLGAGAWEVWHRFFDEDAGVRNLANQIWLDRLPRDQRDMVNAAVLIERQGRRVGVMARGSRWRSFNDGFVWRLEQNNVVRARFPQENKLYTVRVRTWACAGEAPAPFQLCLEVKRGDQTLRYYSRNDWVVRPREDGPPAADVAWLAPAWESARAAMGTEEVGEGNDDPGPSPFEKN